MNLEIDRGWLWPKPLELPCWWNLSAITLCSIEPNILEPFGLKLFLVISSFVIKFVFFLLFLPLSFRFLSGLILFLFLSNSRVFSLDVCLFILNWHKFTVRLNLDLNFDQILTFTSQTKNQDQSLTYFFYVLFKSFQ
jgi:hypothetical protein